MAREWERDGRGRGSESAPVLNISDSGKFQDHFYRTQLQSMFSKLVHGRSGAAGQQAVVFSQDDILHQGPLEKRGQFVRNWKQRHFILRRSTLSLSYYPSASDLTLLGEIKLYPTTRVYMSATPSRPSRFVVENVDENQRQLFLTARSPADLDGWMRALLDGVQRAQSQAAKAIFRSAAAGDPLPNLSPRSAAAVATAAGVRPVSMPVHRAGGAAGVGDAVQVQRPSRPSERDSSFSEASTAVTTDDDADADDDVVDEPPDGARPTSLDGMVPAFLLHVRYTGPIALADEPDDGADDADGGGGAGDGIFAQLDGARTETVSRRGADDSFWFCVLLRVPAGTRGALRIDIMHTRGPQCLGAVRLSARDLYRRGHSELATEPVMRGGRYVHAVGGSVRVDVVPASLRMTDRPCALLSPPAAQLHLQLETTGAPLHALEAMYTPRTTLLAPAALLRYFDGLVADAPPARELAVNQLLGVDWSTCRAFYARGAGGSFHKTSRHKNAAVWRFAPTNLVVQVLWSLHSGMPTPASVSLTMGCPAAHTCGFKRGGVRRLRAQMAGAPPGEEHDALRAEAAQRLAVAGSQALAAAATAAVAFLELASEGSMAHAAAVARWPVMGLLLNFQSLLSTQGSEAGMLEDMDAAVQFLRGVRLRVVEGDAALAETEVVVGRSVPTTTTATDDQVLLPDEVEIALPAWRFQRLPGQFRRRPEVQLHTALFTQGVNERQTVANTMGTQALQDAVNDENLRSLRAYVHAFLDRTEDLDPAQRDAVARKLDALDRKLQESHATKNVLILVLASEIGDLLGAARVICCKSGKDRTSMAVTLYETQTLTAEHQIVNGRELCDVLRAHGVRRDNVELNTGNRYFAFNALQHRMLPEVLRPPSGTYSGSVAS